LERQIAFILVYFGKHFEKPILYAFLGSFLRSAIPAADSQAPSIERFVKLELSMPISFLAAPDNAIYFFLLCHNYLEIRQKSGSCCLKAKNALCFFNGDTKREGWGRKG
jgi:hypothetical protein